MPHAIYLRPASLMLWKFGTLPEYRAIAVGAHMIDKCVVDGVGVGH